MATYLRSNFASLAVLVLCSVVFSAVAMGQTPDQKTEKIRAEAQRIGIGNRMNVYPKAGGKVQGRMAEVRSDSFLLTPKKGGAPIEFRFADLERISRDHSKNPWITAAVGIGAAVLIVAAVALSGGN